METKPLFSTIVAGKYKGKKLMLPSLESTRSTKAILKGSLFDTLQYDIVDEVFVEVFGGSGSMGLEALSRGAKHAYFIEKDKAAFGILKRNCEAIDTMHTTALHGDSFIVFPSLISTFTCKAYFYFDPPFSIRDGMENVYENVLKLIAAIPQEKAHFIAIEHMSELELPQNIGLFTRQKTKKFGKSSLSYYM
ncbi:16S rRNA (guanine(966)-N(2))-methyltransferase RsmD [Sulfurospirillum barnesii]|uniref:RNA methyltransferase, RsmD family n=1 Tax=Sulfurospirillum barnesii (strain ATCC 700032 / DSM 10660 / SES-3) TaxID=760154 RepID=I3XWT9_SULBS|nr:16S rRNA (guanine(966)-N(2))-methyltransferase RsmD [Sulfurospirillum barnesii]AFL68413.1 RNA methyltransferase, RsmD family [Sulfurospirillum barnesii SES-3]